MIPDSDLSARRHRITTRTARQRTTIRTLKGSFLSMPFTPAARRSVVRRTASSGRKRASHLLVSSSELVSARVSQPNHVKQSASSVRSLSLPRLVILSKVSVGAVVRSASETCVLNSPTPPSLDIAQFLLVFPVSLLPFILGRAGVAEEVINDRAAGPVDIRLHHDSFRD